MNLPFASSAYTDDLEFPSGVGFVTNHSISIVAYSQPYAFRCSAIHFAFALNCSSLIVVPYPSQLFHPIGGFAASKSLPPFAAVCAAIGRAPAAQARIRIPIASLRFIVRLGLEENCFCISLQTNVPLYLVLVCAGLCSDQRAPPVSWYGFKY